MAFELTYNGDTLPIDITQQLINYSVNDLNVKPSYLITKLHYEGLWGGSAIAQSNNNWGGMTWNTSWTSPYVRSSGVTITKGSPRPAIEGGHYIRYASVQDFLIDWSYLIRRGGIYNVADSPTFDLAVKGMFVVGGATYDYASMNVETSQERYELYLSGMVARRNAINNANDMLLDTIDNGNYSTGDPLPEPDPNPNPDPFPEEPIDDPSGINLALFVRDLKTLIKKMLTADIYQAGNSQQYKNNYLILLKQLDNMYKIKPNTHFFDAIDTKFTEFNSSYIPEPDPNPDPDPVDPNPILKSFPVRIENGINFYKRSSWGVGTLQRNMTYGVRSNGDNHYGYDIGGGGGHHTIYSITNGTIIQANFANGIGYRLIIENDNDLYFIQYGHLDTFIGKVGDKVVAGDPIAIMGQSGGDYAIHLDVKIATSINGFYSYDTSINPEPYLGIDRDNHTTLPQP